jgi:acyl-homoserine lactone acylase PvdQ
MRRAGGIAWRLVRLVVVVLLLALVGVIVMGAVTTQRGWAQTTGTITIAGLHRPVTVIRDRAGIIQITADDRHGDLIPLWANGDTVPLPFSPANVASSAVQTLTLTPP